MAPRRERDLMGSFAEITTQAPAPKAVETPQRHDVEPASHVEGVTVKRDAAEPVKRPDVKPAKDRRNHVSVYVSPKVQLAVRRLALDIGGVGMKANDLYVEGIRLVLEKHGITTAEFDRLNAHE